MFKIGDMIPTKSAVQASSYTYTYRMQPERSINLTNTLILSCYGLVRSMRLISGFASENALYKLILDTTIWNMGSILCRPSRNDKSWLYEEATSLSVGPLRLAWRRGETVLGTPEACGNTKPSKTWSMQTITSQRITLASPPPPIPMRTATSRPAPTCPPPAACQSRPSAGAPASPAPPSPPVSSCLPA